MALGVTDPFFRSFAVHSNCMCPPRYRPGARPPDTGGICKGNSRDRFLFFSPLAVQNRRNFRPFEIKFLDLQPENGFSRAFRELLTS